MDRTTKSFELHEKRYVIHCQLQLPPGYSGQLSNAFAAKYSPADAPIHVAAELKSRQLTVSVADRGPGIDDFEQALIFDKFYRGRNQRTRIQGTGMGLAMAKAIVKAHGGGLGVTSQLGHGSVFFFTLPAV